MINRRITEKLIESINLNPAVALLGPRQVGKTTLSYLVGESYNPIYLDMELPRDLEKLSDAEAYLTMHEDRLVIIDEVQRVPGLFGILRNLIDRGIRNGRRTGRFLLLGSASVELLRQSGETLAGRIAYLELTPLDITEVGLGNINRLWERGGFPLSFLADSAATSANWRSNFITTYLERDIPQLGPRLPNETLRRFWTMLAHSQGGMLNASQLSKALAVDVRTINRYLDLLIDLLLVLRLPPYHGNLGKRLVKSPKIYLRDSGILHTLIGVDTLETLLGHPIAGLSWEGFILENLINSAPPRTSAFFYRTAGGAELDLVLEFADGTKWAIEIKRGYKVHPSKGLFQSIEDLKPQRAFMLVSSDEHYKTRDEIEIIGISQMLNLIKSA